MALSTIEGDLFVRGTISGTGMTVPANAVGDSQVTSGSPITADKLEHRYRKVVAQPSTQASADETHVAIVVQGTNGTVNAFKCGCITVPATTATVDFDLLRNGSSILSSTVQVGSGQTARELVAGTISTSTMTAADVYEVSFNASAGTPGNGPFVIIEWDEDAA